MSGVGKFAAVPSFVYGHHGIGSSRYSSAPRPAHSHRGGPAAGARVGRVERQAAASRGRLLGRRDLVGHAAIDIYHTLFVRRGRKVGKGELLVLIPRCLSKQALDGVLAIAGRYEVPVFVATRGQLARRVIRERRPRAVLAVACERDMMTGLRDVAGKLPVLGLTMRLPNGPCRDAMLDLETMERWVQSLVGTGA